MVNRLMAFGWNITRREKMILLFKVMIHIGYLKKMK